jgi:hypothetical protein
MGHTVLVLVVFLAILISLCVTILCLAIVTSSWK